MEQKFVKVFYGLMVKAKDQNQADIAYAMTMKKCIDLNFDMNTLKEITHAYGLFGK